MFSTLYYLPLDNTILTAHPLHTLSVFTCHAYIYFRILFEIFNVDVLYSIHRNNGQLLDTFLKVFLNVILLVKKIIIIINVFTFVLIDVRGEQSLYLLIKTSVNLRQNWLFMMYNIWSGFVWFRI